MGTNGDDILFFEGSLGHLTMTLVNPYTGYEALIDDEYNVNSTTYDGLLGTDILIGTDHGDYLSIQNSVGMQLVKNIELFIAGDGGDVINLASSNLTYGDVTIHGGAGNDILWANIGNDTIYGAEGNDILDGGPGNDYLRGNADHDILFGGAGNDRLDGGLGNDILYGGTDLGLIQLDKDFIDDITFPVLQERTNIVNLGDAAQALGINADNLSVDYGTTASITFGDARAGYNNSLGVYRIAADGTIEDASILWSNVKTAYDGLAHSIDLPVGEEGGTFGFFIIANGDRVNKGYTDLDISEAGNIKFVYDLGGGSERAANVHDDGAYVTMVYDDGVTLKILKGNDYHTTPRDGDNSINGDGATHALSGLIDQGSDTVLRIGFEDLPNNGDADFNDVIFDLDIDAVHVDASEIGADTLIGGAGDDLLYGEAGDDILVIGDGLDDAYGGAGADQFVFDLFDAQEDTIHDFNAADGDVINITDILSGYDGADDINDFIQLIQNGADTEIHVNADGDTGGAFTAIAVVEGGLDATLAQLIDSGSFVVDQSVVI